MGKHTIGEAVRMVGHLLEHNGIVGPFAATKEGGYAMVHSPEAFGWCMSGACSVVSQVLGVDEMRLRKVVVGALDPNGTAYGSPVVVWERETNPGNYGTTPENRLALARELQVYNG